MQIPLPGLDSHRGSWANLSVDLAGLTSMCFSADAFQALDLLAIGPTCRVRKIFTTKGAVGQQDAEEEDDGVVSGEEWRRGKKTMGTTKRGEGLVICIFMS